MREREREDKKKEGKKEGQERQTRPAWLGHNEKKEEFHRRGRSISQALGPLSGVSVVISVEWETPEGLQEGG